MLINDRCYDMSDNMMNNDYHQMPAMDCCQMPMSNMCSPVMECPQERCCHREFVHEVPQE